MKAIQISRDDAFSLLRKWSDEHRVINCICKFSKGLTYTLGHIIEFSGDSIAISASKSKLPLGEAFSATISLAGADYDYIEGRHAPEHFQPKMKQYDALLTITYRVNDVSIGLAVLPPLEEFAQQ